jgi:uncharacterized membrane protein YczE
MTRRLVQLHVALALYGVGAAFQIRSELGLDPWDAFHQGLALHANVQIGTMIIIVGLVALLLWIPLRQRPGIGTLINVILVGVSVNVGMSVLPTVNPLPWQIVLLFAGILTSGVASGMSVSAGLGPGPRDGLMTGLADRAGWSIRMTRTGLELLVLGLGYLLGGTVGIGTVAFAILVGPVTQFSLRLFAIDPLPNRAIGDENQEILGRGI